MKTAAIILAAGASTRLGTPKQLVRLDDQPGGERLLERAVRVATEAMCMPLVILGAGAEEIADQCRLDHARVVINAGWARGMGSSIASGVAALGPEMEAAILMTCDQPAVTAAHLQKLCAEGERLGDCVASAYAGRRGVPAWFGRPRFRDLLALDEDAEGGPESGGARHLLATARTVVLHAGEWDVDTAEALQAARAFFGRRGEV